MKSVAFRMLCRVLIVSLFAMLFQPAMAGVIGTDRALATTVAPTERMALVETLSRSDVASQLLAQGADPSAVQLRVASMTDQEVSALAGKIDSLPAGAMSDGAKWGVAIIVALVIWYLWK
jgi:hypothetical protein